MGAKKFITTDKHPELKEGLILDSKNKNNSYCFYQTEGNSSLYIEYHIKKGLEKGHIKDVEEKEFTKSDMIGAIYDAHFMYEEDYMSTKDAEALFNKLQRK